VSAFRRVEERGPIPVILVGAGAMGRAWMRNLTASADVDLVGLVDLDLDLAKRAAEEESLGDVVLGTSTAEVAAAAGALAVVDVTVPPAHRPVNEEALRAGLPVLCEKPIAPNLAQALSQAALTEITGELLMVSQSRRYYDHLIAFRDAVRSLGRIGVVTTEFFKAPHFGGFRDEMDHPLLVDMAIHQFDAVRYLVEADPISVSCSAWNPAWSWYRGDAAATAEFEFEGGIRYIFTGSWCSPGLETSWNGSWRVSGAGGSAAWDGINAPVTDGVPAPEATTGAGEEIAGSLAEFVHALRSGAVPSGEIHANLPSLAMVEGAVRSAESGARIDIAGLLEEAWQHALRTEHAEDVRAKLEDWGSGAGAAQGGRTHAARPRDERDQDGARPHSAAPAS
jgi:predicted dehydrogenase